MSAEACTRCGRAPDPLQAAFAAQLDKGAAARNQGPIPRLCSSCSVALNGRVPPRPAPSATGERDRIPGEDDDA